MGKPLSLEVGENKPKSIKTMTKAFLKKFKKQKENKKKEETQSTPTNNKSHHSEEKKFIQPKLFNLSNTALPKFQTSNLLRGLKFTPTPKSKSIELTCGLKAFPHKLRLLR